MRKSAKSTSCESGLLTIRVNQKTLRVADDCSIATLVENLSLRGGPVAVERNRELVPADQHQSTKLRDGDQLEIVSLTGGG